MKVCFFGFHKAEMKNILYICSQILLRWVLLIPTVKYVSYVGLTFCHLLVSFRFKS